MSTPEDKAFARVLGALIESRGLKVAWIADRAALAEFELSEALRGDSGYLVEANIVSLADVLHLSAEERGRLAWAWVLAQATPSYPPEEGL